ncbi:putative SAM-dependent methyltransferase [Desulfosporosinus orientis DSM 765]|uniref:Putative SAM-dependent methyltransferase n=1 Tax=Desulfosporosinus orientis (strain ATCC 19365 / DSM 765 / NCIMB 8382 / VKM B-1628 / Singapore I) TaxID=768706 RepID=G7WJ19_DESOD|nr:class I SAM-dependent methyltransferase [Desulfosporosinus orientis]AET70331.1 putative SAM-dependent methyltransferase [Desulfosporosinus orientis DSM 765]
MTLSVALGPRLQTVASYVPKGSRLGDIGTDHAYLPIFLMESQQITQAVAVDVHAGPYQSALSAVKGRGLEGDIDVRLGDGLMPLKAGEANVLTLAGMGGRTMLDIFAARPDMLKDVSDLIVQPQGAEGTLRLELLEAGWRLKAEQLVEEEERIYVVMAFAKETGQSMAELLEREAVWGERLHPLFEKEASSSDADFPGLVHKLVWDFGPLILEEGQPLLLKLFDEYNGRLMRQKTQMEKSKSPEVIAKIREVSVKMALVEGLRKWLFQLD